MSNDKKIQWVKVGGGSHRLKNGTIIKKDQKFFATEEEIPEIFRDVIKPLNILPSQDEDLGDNAAKFKIVQAGTQGGWYNVVNIATEKNMTEKALRKEEALKLLEELG